MASVYGDPNAILKDLHAVFEDTVRVVRPSMVPQLCTTAPTDGAYEKYAFPSAPAMPRKFGDERLPTGIDVNATYQVNNQTYELTLEFRGDLLADTKAYGYAEVVREAAISAVLYPDYLLSQAVLNGASSGYNGYDGNTFYGDTHLFAALGANNIDNKAAGSGVSITALQTDLQVAIATLRKWKDNAGRLINPQLAEGGGQLLIQCPLETEYDFRRVCNSAWLPLLSNASGENIFRGVCSVVGDGYLTDVNDWYLHYVGMPMRPFVFQEREPLRTDVLGYDSEFFKNTGKVRILAYHRFAIGYFAFYRSIKTTN